MFIRLTLPTLTQACHFKYYNRIFSILNDPYFAGDEIIRTNKRNEEDKETRSRISSHTTSTIAEEAVEQLQASEKLIAGM